MQEGQQLYSSYLVISILNAFLCYTAIVLNIVTIQAIRKTSSLPKTLKTMLLCLAVSDLSVGLLVQPLHIAICVMDVKQVSNNHPTYNITYIAFFHSTNLCTFASFFCVMALTTDRFLAIHLHLRYQELVTHKRAVAVVIFIWVFSAFLSSVRLWIPKNIIYMIYAIAGTACIISTTFFSVKIYLTLRNHLNEIRALQVQQEAQNGQMINVSWLQKFGIAAVYVYVVFLVCYLPNICTLFVKLFISRSSIDKKHLQLYTLTLVFLNSSLNPLIYCWKMRHIRRTIMDNLRKLFLSHN